MKSVDEQLRNAAADWYEEVDDTIQASAAQVDAASRMSSSSGTIATFTISSVAIAASALLSLAMPGPEPTVVDVHPSVHEQVMSTDQGAEVIDGAAAGTTPTERPRVTASARQDPGQVSPLDNGQQQRSGFRGDLADDGFTSELDRLRSLARSSAESDPERAIRLYMGASELCMRRSREDLAMEQLHAAFLIAMDIDDEELTADIRVSMQVLK